MIQTRNGRRLGDRPFPKVWQRTDGGLEFHCPECGKPLIIAKLTMQPGEYVQAICKWCRKERRFKFEDVEQALR